MTDERQPWAYRVRQHYRYVYTGPITAVQQNLVMVPPDRHADQLLLAHTLDVRGTTGSLQVEWQSDSFGNRVCRVQAERVEHALDFETQFTVWRGLSSAHLGLPDAQRRAFSSHTALTAPNDQIRDAARDIAAHSDQPRRRVELALDWAAAAITYQTGITGTQTPAAMALHLGSGVCQDYAHIMLSLLRSLQLPACYVSGHLIGEGAPHAWVEVFLDDGRYAYDPTHTRPTNMNYITVAVGRDFADVTTTSGVFSGAASGRLHWSKHAERVDPSVVAEVGGAAA